MRVLIFYASYGGGHLSAANSIKQYIEQTHPDYEIKMVDCMKFINTNFEKFTTDAYKIMAKEMPYAWGALYKLSDKGPIFHISNFNNKIMSIKLYELFKNYNPDVVISTHPFSSQMTAWLKATKKINCKLANIMTDFAPQNQWLVGHKYMDYIFVSHEGMKKKIAKKGIDENKIFATGIPLSSKFLQNFDKNEIKKSFNLDLNKKTILFFGGGEFGLGKDATIKILKAFINNLKDEYQMVLIAGRNQKMFEKFTTIVIKNQIEDKIKILSYTNQVPELMNISDLVITKPGGLTTTESLASGLPIIIINPIPGQEEENANFLVNSGVGFWIKKPDKAEMYVSEILGDSQKLKRMKIKSKIMAKKNSTQSICDIIFK